MQRLQTEIEKISTNFVGSFVSTIDEVNGWIGKPDAKHRSMSFWTFAMEMPDSVYEVTLVCWAHREEEQPFSVYSENDKAMALVEMSLDVHRESLNDRSPSAQYLSELENIADSASNEHGEEIAHLATVMFNLHKLCEMIEFLTLKAKAPKKIEKTLQEMSVSLSASVVEASVDLAGKLEGGKVPKSLLKTVGGYVDRMIAVEQSAANRVISELRRHD